MLLKPLYHGHVPLRTIDRALMVISCSVGAYFHPENNNYIIGLGESTAFKPVLEKLRDGMLSDKTGRQILRERPRITSSSLNLNYLKNLPSNTLGNTYYKWLEREKVSPDTRAPVKYIDEDELAYIFQRYRECHDFHHAIAGLPITIEGEISVKAFEFANLGLPFAGFGTLFAPFRLNATQKKRIYQIYYPWAFSNGVNCKSLLNVYWEKILEHDINELCKELQIEKPPDLRQLRRLQKIKNRSK
ncbi:ubiquinone biosynthesis protein COQ4 [Ascoidea rubescens DSM 1968]|uniref:4-hydroxy-3-methoxy-5-polyprenylbenzoate decarboxylase n=1 Tax=Ascoidea rubescens DSM 1968 TaxID=1344418 RepID=A0A1D2VDI6_9ASCO|nr:coenzyme Q biosynthesis Coq4 [Ascoidea rubescens DSM 1968]ODV59553.1 coenzyme Q biosynthesis Coq4 [Ascoidea rubescens DSM 1968]